MSCMHAAAMLSICKFSKGKGQHVSVHLTLDKNKYDKGNKKNIILQSLLLTSEGTCCYFVLAFRK